MRHVAAPLVLTLPAGCVPTTKYAYVPVTKDNFEAAQNGDDGRACFAWDTLAGIGTPYEGRSASVIPMAGFKLGKCEPEALTQ